MTSSNSRQPAEYRSLRASTVSPRACSGREVLRGADHGLGLGHGGGDVGEGPGDAEVHHLDVAVRGQHHVGRLDVTVHDPGPVAVLQRGQHACGQVDGLGGVERMTVEQQLAQGPSLDVLHDDVGQGHQAAARVDDVLLTGVVDGDDGRVVQCCSGLGLAAEPGLEDRVPGQVGAQQLDRHHTTEASVTPEVDLGHPAPTEKVADLVPVSEYPWVVAHAFHPCSFLRTIVDPASSDPSPDAPRVSRLRRRHARSGAHTRTAPLGIDEHRRRAWAQARAADGVGTDGVGVGVGVGVGLGSLGVGVGVGVGLGADGAVVVLGGRVDVAGRDGLLVGDLAPVTDTAPDVGDTVGPRSTGRPTGSARATGRRRSRPGHRSCRSGRVRRSAR